MEKIKLIFSQYKMPIMVVGGLIGAIFLYKKFAKGSQKVRR